MRKQQGYRTKNVVQIAIPEEAKALAGQATIAFKKNPDLTFVDIAKPDSSMQRFYKLDNGVILAQVEKTYDTQNSIIFNAVQISKNSIKTGQGIEYLLKQNLSATPEPEGTKSKRSIDLLKQRYKKTIFEKLMSTIQINEDGQTSTFGVMPRLPGDNALGLFERVYADLKAPKKNEGPTAPQVEEGTFLDIPINKSLIGEANLEALNNQARGDVVPNIAQENSTPAVEHLKDELESLNIIKKDEFQKYKDTFLKALNDPDTTKKDESIRLFVKSLISAQNFANSKAKARENPTNIFVWNQPKKLNRKDELVKIKNPQDFFENFTLLLDHSIKICEENVRSIEDGNIERDLKLDNINISGANVYPYDLDEAINIPVKSNVVFENTVAPHGTPGYLSEYNQAVSVFISRKQKIIIDARKAIASYELLNKLDPALQKVIINLAKIDSPQPRGIEKLYKLATIPDFIFNAKSDANSIGVMLEQLFLLDLKIPNFDKKNGGMAQSLAPEDPSQESLIAFLNKFLLITKKLLNADVADTYVSADAVRDLQVLKQDFLKYSSKQNTPAEPVKPPVEPSIPSKKRRQPGALTFASVVKKTKKVFLPFDPEMTAAILNSFDVLSDTVINEPFYKQKIPEIATLKAGTSITVGTKIKKLERDLYRLPNGSIVAEINSNYAKGSYGVVKIWTDIQTGENYAAKVSRDYSREDTEKQQKQQMEKESLDEAMKFEKFYKEAFGGKYANKTQVVKSANSSYKDQLIYVMPYLRKEAKPGKVVSATESKVPQKANRQKPQPERNQSFYYTESQIEEGKDQQNRWGYDLDPHDPEQALRIAGNIKDENVAAALKLSRMEFEGDSTPKTIEEYKVEYSGVAQEHQYQISELIHELNENRLGFIAADYYNEHREFQPQVPKLITSILDKEFANKLNGLLEISKNIALVVQHGHDVGLVFTDLRNDNILVESDNTVRPIDFGGTEVADENLVFVNNELALKATLDYATPDNVKKLIFNVGNYPHAVRARKMLAILELLEEQQKSDKSIRIPEVFTQEYRAVLQKTAFIPTYIYNEKSSLYALACTIEIECIKKITEISDDYQSHVGLPTYYYSPTNDPRIAALNQLLIVTNKLKNPEIIYTAADVARDIADIQKKVTLSKQVAERVKNPSDTSMTMLEKVLLPKTTVKARAAYDPNRVIWNNTVESLVIDLDAQKYEVMPQRDHSVKILSKDEDNKSVAIIKLVDNTDHNGLDVEAKLISSDMAVIKANLRAIVAMAEKDAPIVLENYAGYPSQALQIKKVAEEMQKSDNIKIVIKFDDATNKAVNEYLAAAKRPPAQPGPDHV